MIVKKDWTTRRSTEIHVQIILITSQTELKNYKTLINKKDMNNFLGGELGFFFETAMNEMFVYENNREQWKEDIKRKFRESCNLPRKKKKEVRKRTST